MCVSKQESGGKLYTSLSLFSFFRVERSLKKKKKKKKEEEEEEKEEEEAACLALVLSVKKSVSDEAN